VADAEGEIQMVMSARRMWRLLVVAVVLATSLVVGGSPAGAYLPDTLLSPIRGIGEKCMDRVNDGRTDGTPVQLFTCKNNDNGAQLWIMVAGEIRADFISPKGEFECLDVDGTGNGAHAIMMGCKGGATPTQGWSIDFAHNTLVNQVSGRCLDATNGSSADHTRLQLWDCIGGPNQQWKPTYAPVRVQSDADVYTSTRGQLFVSPFVYPSYGAGGYSVTANGLPPGLFLVRGSDENDRVHFGGVPTQVGTFGVSVTFTDRFGSTGSTNFQWTINPPLVPVPNVIGDTASQATASLQAAGLTAQAAGSLTTDDRSANGQVAIQNPAAGSSVIPGSVVSYTVWHYRPNQCGPSAC
jgi:hypothetical protein